MKSILYALTGIFICTSAHASDTARYYDVSKRIFVEPLALADMYNKSSVRAGVELPIVGNFCSLYGVIGAYPFKPSSSYGTNVKVGIKLYNQTLFRKVTAGPSAYISVNFFYKSQKFTAKDNIEDSNHTVGKPVAYSVIKHAIGMHIEMGAVFAYRRLFVEPYFGLGLRLSTVSNNISDSLFNNLYDINEGSVNRVGNANKFNMLLPSMTLGVRAGYLFKSSTRTINRNRHHWWKHKINRLIGVKP